MTLGTAAAPGALDGLARRCPGGGGLPKGAGGPGMGAFARRCAGGGGFPAGALGGAFTEGIE